MSSNGVSKNLLSYVVPNHYELTIKPDIDNFTFSGNETIEIKILQKTNQIVFNCLNIEIQSANLILEEKELKPSKIDYNEKDETAILSFDEELGLGFGHLNLSFTGHINESMKGFYRSKYFTADNEVRYGAVTQFESINARRGFPCWDLPSYKAKFSLKLIVPKNRVTVSNMPVVNEIDDPTDNTKKIMKFATTPVMSTYLLAYVIGEYDFVEKTNKDGIKIRIYTPVGKSEQGNYALECAEKSLDFYSDYFKIPYCLPKLDLIAISDFAMGAMENWGLVTFRASKLLYDDQNSSMKAKQFIALVVYHELAHQWYGNLVTYYDSKDLWLNEGFATFMEFLVYDFISPEENIWNVFINDSTLQALSLDALNSSHPIQVSDSDDITQIYDAITYEKGSNVIRMLYNFMGEEEFKKGMQFYLKKFSYKNACTKDLWEALEETSKLPISSLMPTWVNQKGFPLLNVESRQDGNNRILKISQEKFSLNNKLNEKDKSSLWMIPISIKTQNNKKIQKVLLETKSSEFTLENVEPNEWIVINADYVSFYRINYSTELINQFYPSIVDKSLFSIDRLMIQDNIFALAQSGKIPTTVYLNLLKFYVDETDFSIWISITDNLLNINKLLSYTEFQEVFHIFVRKLLAKIFEKLGAKPKQGENPSDAILRQKIFSLLITCEDTQALKEANSMFKSFIDKQVLIPSDLRLSVYRSILSNCDDKTYEKFLNIYRETDLDEEKNRVLQAIGFSKDLSRLQKVLQFISSDEVRNQDGTFGLHAMASHKVGCETAWKFFTDNFEEMKKKYSSGNLMRNLIKSLIENFATEEMLHEVSEFFSSNSVPNCENSIEQALETLKSNIDWLNKDLISIKKFLIDN